MIARDETVAAALAGDPGVRSARTMQRHFVHAAGLTQGRFRQIERARYAARLLQHRTHILDVVHQAGYFDQAHLTRSLTHYIGQTPAAILRGDRQLSFLYKTSPADIAMMRSAAHHDDIAYTPLDRPHPQRAGHPVPRL